MYHTITDGDLGDVFVPITAAISPCYFGLSPAVLDGPISGVTADGVALLSSDFRLIGRDGIELVGQAGADYVAGNFINVRVLVPCDG